MKTVRIEPTGAAYIDGVPAVEQEVTEGRARELLAYDPPAFRVVDDPPPTPEPPPAAGKAANRTAGNGGPSVSPQAGEE